MDKALKMGKTSAAGGLRLFVGKILSTLLLAVGQIMVGLLIAEGDLGLYAIVLIPVSTMLLFQDWGVGSAITRECARYRSLKREAELRNTIVTGLTFEIITGLTLTLVSILMANFIGSNILGKPESGFLIVVASFSILATSILGISQSILVGFERMGLSSLLLICQAVVQCVLGPVLVYIGYGALGVVLAYSVSLMITGIAAVSLIHFAIFRKLPVNNEDKTSRIQKLRPLLAYGIPLAIGTIIIGLSVQFVSFVMAYYVDLVAIGNRKIATQFSVLLTLITAPLSTVLFPAFSKVDPQEEPQLLKKIFATSVKYTALFLVPATMAMMVLSGPIIGTVYGNKWLDAPLFLSLHIILSLFSIFGSLNWSNLFTAFGETKMLMKLNFLTLSVSVPLALVLIPQFGMIGAIMVEILVAIPSNSIGLYYAWKLYGTKADFPISAKIFLSSALSAAFTYLFLRLFISADWIRLTTGLTMFLLIYLVTAPLIGAIYQSDVNNLRSMFSGLGIISKILEIPFIFVEKVIVVRARAQEIKFFSPLVADRKKGSDI
jgi:O-antigen/teichoic acid export membrane protein